MNKTNNTSNSSTVLPILCEHGQFSAIVETVVPFILQALDGRHVDDEIGYRVVLFQH